MNELLLFNPFSTDWLNTWVLARAAGIGGYILLTLSVASGLYQSIRAHQSKASLTAAVLHESAARWSLYFIMFHFIMLAYDSYSHFTWMELLVPFQSHLDFIPMAFGIVAGYLLVFTIVTTEWRAKIGHKVWKKLHMATPILYLFSTIHGITNGTDTYVYWLMYLISSVCVALLLIRRIRIFRLFSGR